MIMINIYKHGPEKLKLSAKCDYKDDKQMIEHLRHMQCKVITFVMVK